MPQYLMNDASIDLPEHFADKTMHLFTTDANKGGSFTFVVSRASMEEGDTVDTFASRIVAEMRKALPRFELKKLNAREVDSEGAREIDYQWISDGTLLHQRQTVVMLPARGENPVAISFIGTCPKQFSEAAEEQYAALIKSVKLQRLPLKAFEPRAIDQSSSGIVFVLRETDGLLRVLPGVAQLFEHDLAEARNSKLAFFDAAGAPMTLAPAPVDSTAWKSADGTHFTLWSADPAHARSLAGRLERVNSVVGLASLPDAGAVRDYLASVALAS